MAQKRQKILPYGIHWFRRDLRIPGNLALKKNLTLNQGRVLGLFCFDETFLARADFSFDRFGYFLNTLKELKEEMERAGGDLLFLEDGPKAAFHKIFEALKKARLPNPQLVSFCRDYEPFALVRDLEIKNYLVQTHQIKVLSERDHLLIEPWELLKEDGTPYRVYTAFARKWYSMASSSELGGRVRELNEAIEQLTGQRKGPYFKLTWDKLFKNKNSLDDQLVPFCKRYLPRVKVPLPKAGATAAFQRAQAFIPKIPDYQKKRDYPALSGTSQLSVYLKNGSITVPLLLNLFGFKFSLKSQTGKNQFLKELVWREFYYHILYHFPHVEHEAFLSSFNEIQWENNEKKFQAWMDGKTGYPIVDAGMRQLNQTGWMHNRVRMVVASFLVKDLLIDWRWGERYFMNKLLDGDLALNNGGWQWAASTGCDAVPYFRVFNPTLQGKRFDAKGDYILQFIPERKAMLDVHEPVNPIVDHKIRKSLAVLKYKEALEKSLKSLV